jgi:hypothetical protein
MSIFSLTSNMPRSRWFDHVAEEVLPKGSATPSFGESLQLPEDCVGKIVRKHHNVFDFMEFNEKSILTSIW